MTTAPVVLRADGPRPTGFAVIGERCSGTNFARALIKRNLGLAVRDDLGWKHGFPHTLAYPRDVLLVVVVRDALDWAKSMFAKPWHAPETMQRLGFSEFLRAPWESVVDRPDYFGLPKGSELIGAPLQLDRHPITGAAFANILQMRNAKTAAFLGLENRHASFVALRHEALARSPETVLNDLRRAFGLEEAGAFRGVHRRLGSRFAAKVADRPAAPQQISPADRAFILGELDLGQERRLGYRYG